ncbi:hypothetical protein KKB43_00850 [Patescibacteria group bacterium]|nr:hypothetical protein [Patescibacteria group bacterium]MBU4141771.1 hypothetical protein [Patescibacteria group bacterium]MBU4338832.1 hypothetical protein [Patescibacteria group bacterium]MBU4579547.1 hypothetical protein [Patescibacteria group bacterium]
MKNYKKFWKLGKKEFNTEIFDINKSGELIIKEGNYQYNVKDLIKKFGTPLEITLPFVIERRLNDLFEQFNRYIKFYNYHGRFFYHYPMKVNQNKEFVLPIISEGGNLEVSSANELWLVKKLWEQDQFNSKIRVICNGPKTPTYLGLISDLKARGLHIIPIIEDENELAYFTNSKNGKISGDLGIRVDIDVKVKSHWDKKFNRFGFTSQQILEIGKIKNLKLLHYHIGSQIEQSKDLVLLLKAAAKLFAKMKKNNPGLDMIDIGGGFAVPYEKKKMYPTEGVVKNIISTLSAISREEDIDPPDIIVEWGRYLVAPAQITIYKVIHQKAIEKGPATKWYIIDGSFINDLSDTWTIHQKWHVTPVNNMNAKKFSRVWLAGSSCDSDDKYTAGGHYIMLPAPEEGDPQEPQYLAVFDTGAYQDALSSHHCLLSSPAKIIAQNGLLTLARKRETPDEIGKQFGW